MVVKKGSINSKRIKKYIEEVEEYLRKYKDQITEDNAEQAVSEFNDQWLVVIDYMGYLTEHMGSKYGDALVIYSDAISNLCKLTKKMFSD